MVGDAVIRVSIWALIFFAGWLISLVAFFCLSSVEHKLQGAAVAFVAFVALAVAVAAILAAPEDDLGEWMANWGHLALWCLLPVSWFAGMAGLAAIIEDLKRRLPTSAACVTSLVGVAISLSVIFGPIAWSGLLIRVRKDPDLGFRQHCSEQLAWSPRLQTACEGHISPEDDNLTANYTHVDDLLANASSNVTDQIALTAPEACREIARTDVIDSRTGPVCYTGCRALDLYVPQPWLLRANPAYRACFKASFWKAFAPGGIYVSAILATVYGCFSLRAFWTFAWGEGGQPSTYEPLTLPGVRGPSRTFARGESGQASAYEPFTLPVRGPSRTRVQDGLFCSQSDLQAQRLRMTTTLVLAAIEPASDVFSVVSLLANGQPSYAMLLAVAVFMPNKDDVLQTEHTGSLVASLRRGFLTKAAWKHRQREGLYEGYIGAMIAVVALMRTPNLGCVTMVSLLLNVALSIGISLPGSSQAAALLSDPTNNVDDFDDAARYIESMSSWTKHRRSVALLALAPVCGFAACPFHGSYDAVAVLFFGVVACVYVVWPLLVWIRLGSIGCDRGGGLIGCALFGFLLSLKDVERECGVAARGLWVPTEALRTAVLMQNILTLIFYGLLWPLIMTMGFPAAQLPWWPWRQLLSRLLGLAQDQQVRQAAFLLVGSVAALFLVLLDVLYPPEGWTEPEPEVGDWEVLEKENVLLSLGLIPRGQEDDVAVLAEPTSEAEVVARLEEKAVVHVVELKWLSEDATSEIERLWGRLRDGGWVCLRSNAAREKDRAWYCQKVLGAQI